MQNAWHSARPHDFSEGANMTKPEFTGHRDLAYNRWHRTIGPEYYMIDLDCVEWRHGRGTVAIMERTCYTRKYSIAQILEFKKFQLKVTAEVARAANVPAYLILYEKNQHNTPTSFHVFELDITTGEANFIREMTEQQYAEFLRNL